MAQNDFRPGFLVTLVEDTIRGLVDFRSNSSNYKTCRFKLGDDITSYTPRQLAGYGYLQDKYFTSEVIEDAFVEVLVQGDMNLYKYETFYLLQKNGGELQRFNAENARLDIHGNVSTTKDRRWRGILSLLISDCLTDYDQSRFRLEEKYLTELTVRYNECRGAGYTVFKARKSWTHVQLGAAGGISRSAIHLVATTEQFPYLAKSYQSLDPTVGIFMAISSPRVSEKFALQPEMHLSRSTYAEHFMLTKRHSVEYHTTNLQLTTLSIPVSLRYAFPERRYGFYVQGGVGFAFHLASKAEYRSEEKFNEEFNPGNVVDISEGVAFGVNRSQVGYTAGLGLLRNFNGFKGGLSLRYTQLAKLNQPGDPTPDNSRLSIRNDHLMLSLIVMQR